MVAAAAEAAAIRRRGGGGREHLRSLQGSVVGRRMEVIAMRTVRSRDPVFPIL